MTGALLERDEQNQAAPRRVPEDGVRPSDDGVRTTITIRGESFELTDEQLTEAARLIASGNAGVRTKRSGNVAADQLRSIIQRIEKLEEEKAGIASDIKDVYAEARGNGLCPKTIRKVIALRKKDAAERDEEEYLIDTYMQALGMLPLFEEAE
jgi:uncharacterized protein (UPF0335 family)